MNADTIDEHNYMQYNLYLNTDQNHYLPEDNNNHMAMSHLEDTTNSQSSIHSYMHSNSTNKQLSSNANLNSIHQSYSHSINTMDSHNQMLNSPQMIQQIDQNSTNNQMNYCKVPSAAISNHFETPPLPHAYHQQNIRNHQSPNNNASDLNHYNQKYCADSNESANVSNTLTHISETDNSNSHNNYAPTPPQTQPIVNKYSTINNLNLISTPQTYSSMACHSSSDWSNIPANLPDINSQLKCLKNTNSNQTSYENESRYSYLNQGSSDYHQSITSTPVSLQSSNDNYRNRTSKNINNNQYCTNQEKTNSYSNDLLVKKSKPSPSNNNSELLSNSIKKDYICAEKRNIIIFKVVEQILEPSTKRILKQTVIKNEEFISNCGQVQFDTISNDTISSSGNTTPSIVGSSGLLGDISGLSNSKSVNNLSSANSIEFSNNSAKNNLYFESKLNKSRTKLKTPEPKLDDIPPTIKEEKLIVSQSNSIDESDEEERRQTASALLSLQSVSNNNTPVKSADDDEECALPVSAQLAATISSGAALLSDIENMPDSKISGQYLPLCAKLRPGIKVMAKWKDKNFYPAVIVKQLETHKWSVKFEDSANRNLFETELIRIEHLLVNQDVMVTISDLCIDDGSTICIPATIKKVYSKNDKKIEFDTEHFDKEKLSKVIVKHQLKDIFLNVEQSNSILAKVSKPTTSAAVFADVDLDNIVVGKRSRSIKQNNEVNASTLKKKVTECSVSDSNANCKKKKKLNDDSKKSNELNFKVLADTPKKNDYQIIGHYHESSLSVSPRMAKSSISMPTNELEKILGPVPKVNSKLFDKMIFMLTSGDRNKNIFSEQESNPERSIPFDKTYLTKQIITGGGKVYDTFEEMKSSNDNLECVLIADTYHRSIKYIQCLAAGIPIASHLLVIDSCRANKLLERDSYILPAGYSVITHALSSDKNTLKKSSVLFKGVKFYFGSKSADKLEKLWTPVLFAAQAIIVKQDSNMHNILSKKSVDIIIGDASCSAELIKKAKQVKIPVISSEYIVQCLINGRKLSYDACPFFSYSYK